MSKAFTKETDNDEELLPLPEMPIGVRNYITPPGLRSLKNALAALNEQQASANSRQAVPYEDAQEDEATAFSAQRMREIDQRLHYLRTRIDLAEVVDPAVHAGNEQIFFGAMVTYYDAANDCHTVTIVGLDEIDPANGLISWLSPVAQALLKAHKGDTVELSSTGPNASESAALHIVAVNYPQPSD